MLKLLPLIFAIACGSCGPAELKTTGLDTAPSEPSEPYPWATWETCAHNIGDNPCNFSLMDQNDQQVELYEHYGKVILLDFSVMWCGPCNSIAPLAAQYTEIYGEENFVWITILIEDQYGGTVDVSELQSWSAMHSTATYIPVLAGTRELIDITEPLEDGYPITAWPTIVVIDRTMTIYAGMSGFSESTIESWVTSLL